MSCARWVNTKFIVDVSLKWLSGSFLKISGIIPKKSQGPLKDTVFYKLPG